VGASVGMHGDKSSYRGQTSIDTLVARLAARQQGNVTRQQLLDLGLGAKAIAYRVDHGRLYREHQGVYGVGRPATTPLERAAAAVLACGPGASLSHFGAAKLWGFIGRWPAEFDVTVPGDRRLAGVRVHRCPGLSRGDRRRQLGIWATSPARTVLDCAPSLDDVALARLVNDARLSGQLRLPALAETLARFPLHAGTLRLRPFVERRGGPTRSEFEDAFASFCERFGLPQPVMNTIVAGHEVDALFEAERVIVELDGYAFHSGRDAFESDRDRDADTLEAGYPTVRVTWERMIGRPAREAERLRAILSRGSGPGAGSPPRT
jgi:hypothetical protein